MSIFPKELLKYSFFKYFEEISKIPRGSNNSEPICEYLTNFAKAKGLGYKRDKLNNVIIKKVATEGYENRPTVILQGHTDIVIAKDEGIEKDMEREGVDMYLDGDFIKARGTTLGADNGMAVAYALAILDSNDIPHPTIEAVFTSDEEIGMIGASGIDLSDLDGELLINLDSEEEGYFTVGCAGGICSNVTVKAERSNGVYRCQKLAITGLRGGHSGGEINAGRENAIRILGEILGDLKEYKIAKIQGGNADNAIPKDAMAILSTTHTEALKNIIDRTVKKYVQVEEHIRITLIDAEDSYCFTEEDSKRITETINRIPNGIIKMSEDVEGLVESSLNLGVIKTDNDNVILSYAIRSSKEKGKSDIRKAVCDIAKAHGATVTESGDYPGWDFKKESHLRNTAIEVYKRRYGKEPVVMAIHAGLECGMLSQKKECLDCISFGPDQFDAHTTRERVSVSSAIRVWEMLLDLIISL